MNPDTFALACPAGFWSRLGWSLWPARCLACAEPGLAGCDLCATCWTHWPRTGRSCLGCAMPLPVDVAGETEGAVARVRDGGSDADRGAVLGATLGAALDAGPDIALDANLDTDLEADRWHPADSAPRAADMRRDRCGACRNRASPLHEVRAAAFYRAPLDRLLPRFKFHRDLAAGRLLASTMAAAFAPRAASLLANGAAATPRQSAAQASERPNARRATGEPGRRTATTAARDTPTLVPIPLHRGRLRERGYDQALELARPLSRRLGLALCATGLHRLRATPAQSRLDAARRRRNLRDAFAWTGAAAPPMHAILIDDVMTTGATLHAAALALRRAGAQRVDAWVCARTL